MKRILTLLMMSIWSLALMAQDLAVSGVVTSADDGQSLPGVTVVVKGTTNGTITNIDGRFQLTAPADAILQFSFIGMKSQEIAVNGRTGINVAMEIETTGLDEVVVIGYGTQKKEDVTGAVSMVNAETIENLKPVKVEQALQGTMTGCKCYNTIWSTGSRTGYSYPGYLNQWRCISGCNNRWLSG